jgi:hypothetical protein
VSRARSPARGPPVGAGGRDRPRPPGRRRPTGIQRFIADLHGRQRRRLGWTADDVTREFTLLLEVLEGEVQRRAARDEGLAREATAALSNLVERTPAGAREPG